MKAKSSTCLRDVRILLADPCPDSPYCRNVNGDFISGPGIAVEDVDGHLLAMLLVELRLGIEQVNAARRAFHEQPDDRCGLGAKCGARGASGSPARRWPRAARQARRSRSASAHSPSPAPARLRNSRRVRGNAYRPQLCWRLVDIDELVQAEQNLGKIRRRPPPMFIGRNGCRALHGA